MTRANFEIIHRSGRLNLVPDALSRAPVDLISTEEADFDDWYVGMLRKIAEFPEKFPL